MLPITLVESRLNRQPLPHVLPGTVIKIDAESITSVNHLRPTLHANLVMLFDEHVHEVTKNVTGKLMQLCRANANFDKSMRIIVVELLVPNVINYCILIWAQLIT